jgi:Immunoglobulin I-set domain
MNNTKEKNVESRHQVYKDKVWCRVGKALKLENIEVTGEPPAKVTWSFQGVDQSTVKDITVSNPDYLTSIVINNAQRKQVSSCYKSLLHHSSYVVTVLSHLEC